MMFITTFKAKLGDDVEVTVALLGEDKDFIRSIRVDNQVNA